MVKRLENAGGFKSPAGPGEEERAMAIKTQTQVDQSSVAGQKAIGSVERQETQAQRVHPAVAIRRVMGDPTSAPRRADARALQRAVGNRKAGRGAAGAGARLPVQAKLMVTPAGDRYEREADRVADMIVNTSAPVQRQIEEEEVQGKPVIQRWTGDGGFEAGSDFQSQLNSVKGGGKPLPSDMQAAFGQQLGADLSKVRVHTGPASAELAHQIQARAFTHRADIHLGEGQYNPETKDGKLLLAHEAIHTIQQTGGTQFFQGAPLDSGLFLTHNRGQPTLTATNEIIQRASYRVNEKAERKDSKGAGQKTFVDKDQEVESEEPESEFVMGDKTYRVVFYNNKEIWLNVAKLTRIAKASKVLARLGNQEYDINKEISHGDHTYTIGDAPSIGSGGFGTVLPLQGTDLVLKLGERLGIAQELAVFEAVGIRESSHLIGHQADIVDVGVPNLAGIILERGNVDVDVYLQKKWGKMPGWLGSLFGRKELWARKYIDALVHITMDIAHGLSEMHERGYAHCDLKPSNVIVKKFTDFKTARLIDLGLSTSVEGPEPEAGTPKFMPSVNDLALGDYQVLGACLKQWIVRLPEGCYPRLFTVAKPSILDEYCTFPPHRTLSSDPRIATLNLLANRLLSLQDGADGQQVQEVRRQLQEDVHRELQSILLLKAAHKRPWK